VEAPGIGQESVEDFRLVSGVVLRPGHPSYDEARRVHNGMIDKRPALIASCRDTADVVSAVGYGGKAGLEISIRGGGHNVAGTAVTDGGLMIDLAPMRQVEVDAGRRLARAEGGVTWGILDRATQKHGLAVTGGMISSTGIAGLTLGGGLGWLMGKHGLSVDNLVSAEVVLADGRVLVASEEEHPDLFWGLRGGGGNFGVVTRFEYRLHPIGPLVTGVGAAYPFAAAADVLRFYRELTTDGPDELTVNAGLRFSPGGSGEKIAGLIGCHVGTPDQAERDLADLRRFGDPLELEIGPTEYTAINSAIDPAYPRSALNYWKSSFLRELTNDAIDAIVDQFATCPSPTSSFVIENLHGEVTRVPVEATAVPHREPGYNFLITSVWLDPAASDENVAWTRAAFEAVRPFTEERRYSNYLAADETDETHVRSAFGPNYERLAALKSAYDPTNLFRLNQNVRPLTPSLS
jgi:FAD/FMN-containing dehydrogenase